MAGAIIIASALGVLLLVIAGYVLVSANLASADSIASAQKDMAQKKDEQVHTAIMISNAKVEPLKFYPGRHNFTFDLKNIGSAPIGDFNRTDVFIAIGPAYITERYSFNGVMSRGSPGDYNSRTWGNLTITPDTTHPYMLDPGETMYVDIGDCPLDQNAGYSPLYVVNVTTPNGITNGTIAP